MMHLRLYLRLDVMQRQSIQKSAIPERVRMNFLVDIICTVMQNVMGESEDVLCWKYEHHERR